MIVGVGICANRIDATFVNNLSIVSLPTSATGLPVGSVWRDTATTPNTLRIV
jgi:hypothetical protein